MKRTLLFALALAVIPVGVDAQSPTADFWRARAEKGDAEGQFYLGNMYDSGDGVPQDDAEAVRLYRLAAEQGYTGAYEVLGRMYHGGRGVPQDYVEAVRLYRLAAEQGYAEAQFLLGAMYDRGDGVPEDIVLAYMWYNLAAANGDERKRSRKEFTERRMTREQIAEAQRLSREWLAAHPPGD